MAHLDPQLVAGLPVQAGPSLSDDLRLLSDASGERDLQLVARLAAGMLGKGGASCQCGLAVVVPGRAPETIAATDDIPVRMDWLQGEWQQGPASDLVERDVVSGDLATDVRWPDVGSLAAAVIGVRSMVSVRVPLDADCLVALSWYSASVASFDVADLVRARMVARLVVPAVAEAIRRFSAKKLEPTGDGGRVATALGLVMSRYRVHPNVAFALLLDACAVTGGELLDVALEVVETGRLPKGS